MLILQLKCLNWVGASWDWLVFIKLINIKDSCTCGSFRIFPLYITKPLSNNLILSHSFNHAIIWEVNFGQGCTSRQVCQHLVDFVNLCSNDYSNNKCRQAPLRTQQEKSTKKPSLLWLAHFALGTGFEICMIPPHKTCATFLFWGEQICQNRPNF